MAQAEVIVMCSLSKPWPECPRCGRPQQKYKPQPWVHKDWDKRYPKRFKPYRLPTIPPNRG